MNKNILNVTALDGLIKVNSFFSIATLLSIIITMLFKSLENLSSSNVLERLLIDLVTSFRFFLLAWLFAQCMKLTAVKRYMDIKDLIVRFGIVSTALFSSAGFYLLLGSMKDVTGAKTTLFSFSSCLDSSAAAVGCMAGTVYLGLGLYFIGLYHLVFRGKHDDPE